ncbi:hypothetical protein GQ457_14G017660 [Hibiscus cannabinus]
MHGITIGYIAMLSYHLSLSDFTPVCTTDLGKMAAYLPEFEKRWAKLLGFSCHDVKSQRLKLSFLNATTTGRNTNKVLRAAQGIQVKGCDAGELETSEASVLSRFRDKKSSIGKGIAAFH